MIVPGGVDSARLRTLVLAELKKVGLKHRAKKAILKNVKDMKVVFGAPLSSVAARVVSCCGSSLSVPAVVVELSGVLREHAHAEGLFRKAGSASRQREIKQVLDYGGSVSAAAIHPVDAASLLKLYLRALPDPLINIEVQELLLRCRLVAGAGGPVTPLLHTLMLLPVLHLHLLHFIMELLSSIASRHKENLMDAGNLAIVLAPSIMPLPAAATTTQRLEHHVALVKIFIENSKHIGSLTEDLLSQLDGDEASLDQARRKKRRSGSLNRVLNGLRKMVGGGDRSAPTPARDLAAATPIISKSAAKRKLDLHEGLSAKIKKDIRKNLPQKELSFTPKKMGMVDRKKLKMSVIDSPIVSEELICESSFSSEDLLSCSDNLFSNHDTIDLSASKQLEKDYVKIPKQEFEEIKSRVSAIESRLSKEWTEPQVEPFQQVQNAYERTLEDIATINYSSSDHLARRLSRELKIRPSEQHKIIRSPSARKIGTMRRRSKENVVKLVRHKSWNVSTQSQANSDANRFYPYVGLKRGRPNTLVTGLPDVKSKSDARDLWGSTSSENSPVVDLGKVNRVHISRRKSARESTNNVNAISSQRANTLEEHNHPKWKNAAAYFMERTGEADIAQSGRPSVNKLRSQNAGAVLAKAKMFESSSDRSSEIVSKSKMPQNGFARRPRISGPQATRTGKCVPPPVLKVKPNSARIVEPTDSEPDYQNVSEGSGTVHNWDTSADSKRYRKAISPLCNTRRSPTTPAIRKPLSVKSPRSFRTPLCASESRRPNTPLRAAHNTSPRRHSPRLRAQRMRQ